MAICFRFRRTEIWGRGAREPSPCSHAYRKRPAKSKVFCALTAISFRLTISISMQRKFDQTRIPSSKQEKPFCVPPSCLPDEGRPTRSPYPLQSRGRTYSLCHLWFENREFLVATSGAPALPLALQSSSSSDRRLPRSSS